MALEAFSFLNSLVVTNPTNDDFLVEGDDHIRGIKQVLKSTFPAVTGAVTATHTELNRLAGIGSATLKTTGSAGEWVQMASANITGVSANIDFVNGSGGIVISNDYDAYEIELIDVYPASSTTFRLAFSSGSGFPNNATGCNSQILAVSGGVQTVSSLSSQAYVQITDTVPGGALAQAVSVVIRIVRPTASLNAPVFSEYVCNAGTIVGKCYGYSNAGSSQFTGLRVSTASGGTMIATAGAYRFRARRA